MISIGISTFDVFYPFLALCSPLLLAQSAELFRLETGPFHPGGAEMVRSFSTNGNWYNLFNSVCRWGVDVDQDY